MATMKTNRRKARTSEKPSSRSIAKKSPLENDLSLAADEKPNEHRSYIKVTTDNEIGTTRIGMADGKNLFYLGTHDFDLIKNTIAQIGSICSLGDPAKKINTTKVNAALASIIEIDPQDSTELMLATQMVAVHNVSLDMSRRAMCAGQTIEGIEKYINIANKLMRTYTAQVEALNKYRTKGQQRITVQHVNVNDGGQAIVGDVSQGGGNG